MVLSGLYSQTLGLLMDSLFPHPARLSRLPPSPLSRAHLSSTLAGVPGLSLRAPLSFGCLLRRMEVVGGMDEIADRQPLLACRHNTFHVIQAVGSPASCHFED